MVIALASKPGLTGASALSIPKAWDSAWFRGFINNLLKGGDVRNAVGSGGIVVSGTIASPYATIGFGAPVTLPGPVVILTPTTAVSALTINGHAGAATVNIVGPPGGTMINWTDGTVTGQLNTNASQSQFGNSSNHALSFFTNNTTRVVIDNNGLVNIVAPTASGTALTVNSFGSATFGLRVNSGSANNTVGLLLLSNGASAVGVETIRIDNSATTGTGTATFTATNKPTATAGGPVAWIPINLDTVRRYIPVWA